MKAPGPMPTATPTPLQRPARRRDGRSGPDRQPGLFRGSSGARGLSPPRPPPLARPPAGLTNPRITHPQGPLGLQLQVELLQPRHLLQHQAQVFQVAKTLPWEAGPGFRLQAPHLWDRMRSGET